MTEWRFNRAPLLNFRVVRVESVWPDVDKTVIYPELLAFGIDAKKLRVAIDPTFIEAVMASHPARTHNQPELYVNPNTIEKAYPTAEATYIGLVHELAHLRQALTGEITRPAQGDIRAWLSAHHEREALRWGGRQARRMGWSEKRLREQTHKRYGHHDADVVKEIAGESMEGYRLHPKQETLQLLQRRPRAVSVRRYVRRKRPPNL